MLEIAILVAFDQDVERGKKKVKLKVLGRCQEIKEKSNIGIGSKRIC